MPTSGTLLSGLVNQVRQEVGEHSYDFWTDDQVARFINEAKNFVCTDGNFRFMQHKTNPTDPDVSNQMAFLASANDVEVLLPDGFKSELTIYVNGQKLSYRKLETWDEYDSDGNTSSYTMFGDYLTIVPQSANGNVVMRYYRIVPDINNAVSNFPREYEDLLISYAVARCKQDEEISYDISQDLFKRINEQRIFQMRDQEKKRGSRFVSINMLPGI